MSVLLGWQTVGLDRRLEAAVAGRAAVVVGLAAVASGRRLAVAGRIVVSQRSVEAERAGY